MREFFVQPLKKAKIVLLVIVLVAVLTAVYFVATFRKDIDPLIGPGNVPERVSGKVIDLEVDSITLEPEGGDGPALKVYVEDSTLHSYEVKYGTLSIGDEVVAGYFPQDKPGRENTIMAVTLSPYAGAIGEKRVEK